MPSYFYHLSLELYPYPATASAERSHDLRNIYVPSPSADIFTSTFPDHKRTRRASSERKRNFHRRTRTSTLDSELSGAKDIQPRSSFIGQRPSVHTTLSSGNLHDRPVPINKGERNTQAAPHSVTKDWRFGSVAIQGIDMEEVEIKSAGKSVDQGTSANPSSGGLATRGRYVPSNPKNTEVGWGVVHLYKELDETPGLYDDSTSSTGSENGRDQDDLASLNEEDCTTLCILAVPSYMTPSDLLGFLGESTRDQVSHFRLIRTGTVNRYMVLVKFREAKNARASQKKWNGKLFNTMEEEVCHVVFVKTIEFQTSEIAQGPSSFPSMTNDPFTPAAAPASSAPVAPLPASLSSADSPIINTPLATKPPAPLNSLIELPTCPVCLERMDETTGLLTILCQHVFHCACLEKWRGSGCPVCRYTQNDAFTFPRKRGTGGDEPENECSACGATNNLWICLICGNTGCGRYDAAHAFAHWEATGHCFAMDVTTQHVWDYAGDGYVHRLVQNKADGKLVDLPAAYAGNGAMTGFGADTVPREKMESLSMEYTYLLTSQLESQRKYYDDQLERAVDKAAKASAAAEKAVATLDAFEQKFNDLQASHESCRMTNCSFEKDVSRLERRLEKAESLARKLGKDYQEEKTLSKGLMEKNISMLSWSKELEDKAARLEAEKKDLEEQNRDLSFFISGQDKLKQLEAQGEETRDGTVEVPSSSTAKRKKGKKK